MDKLLHFKQSLGAPMVARLVAVDQRHNQRFQPACESGDELVEFYDASFIKERGFQPYGQYIGAYCKSSLEKPADKDLVINSRVPQWFVETDSLRKIGQWLSNPDQ